MGGGSIAMRSRGGRQAGRVIFRFTMDTHAPHLMGRRSFTTISKAPRHDELLKDLTISDGRKVKILDEELHPYKAPAEVIAAAAENRKKPLPPGALGPGEAVRSKAVAKRSSEESRRQCEADPDAVIKGSDYPPNGGFEAGTETYGTIDPDDLLARFGDEKGTYLCRVDVPFEQLGLHPSSLSKGLHFYRALRKIPMLEGTAAAALNLGSPGGGVQMKIFKPVRDLVAEGALEEVPPPDSDDAEPAGSVTETE
ncbi:TNT domain-containing protein [Kribbella sp. CA-293567]|uniref:TNT domain-containing protein n=1 Tax=Kribbella sp. CA-293567 TaxID=3002436 RepID=UPI0022DDE891|nr:TNT domain-containing protein [Kribbella sp. CA-293567]WBQ06485.1 TNT domain-containing protein [Kribbella sp. CA-293567]